MSDLVGNPEDRFSQNEAHMKFKAVAISRQDLNIMPRFDIGYDKL